MEEAVKALAPWPVLQGVIIGLIVAGAGLWMIRKGWQDFRRREADDVPQLVRLDRDAPAIAVRTTLTIEEHKAYWAAFEQLHHIEDNSFRTVKLLEQLVEGQTRVLEGINRFNDIRWNKNQ